MIIQNYRIYVNNLREQEIKKKIVVKNILDKYKFNNKKVELNLII